MMISPGYSYVGTGSGSFQARTDANPVPETCPSPKQAKNVGTLTTQPVFGWTGEKDYECIALGAAPAFWVGKSPATS